MTEKEKSNNLVCENCKLQIDRIRFLEGLSTEDLFILDTPRRTIKISYPVRMDNGKVKTITGFRIQYNDALGPTKGGIRFHQTVDEEDVNELAFLMALKTSLLDLPYGGAKGGVMINPKELSFGELERVARGFVREIYKMIGPENDIPAPDVNTNSQVMAWMMDEYERISGKKSPGSFTGKPLELGGSYGRSESTARGAFYIIEEKYKEEDKQNIKVAIQGFGNAGSNLAKMLVECGFKIVAVSDSSSGLYDENGLNIHEVFEFKHNGNQLKDYKNAKKISNNEVLELDVDVLVPGALGGVINQNNYNEIKANVIVELANAPIDAEVDFELENREIEIIPDILANGGGVVVSYFEWVQNISGLKWEEFEVEKKLKDKMIKTYREVVDESNNIKKPYRTSAYKLAVDRILKAEKLRGNL